MKKLTDEKAKALEKAKSTVWQKGLEYEDWLIDLAYKERSTECFNYPVSHLKHMKEKLDKEFSEEKDG